MKMKYKLLALLALSVLSGCVFVPGDISHKKWMPYPPGSCFRFEGVFERPSITFHSESGYSFLVWMKPDQITPIPCVEDKR